MWDGMVNGSGMSDADAVRTVAFVCQHGASRGPVAAAWFALAPSWAAEGDR